MTFKEFIKNTHASIHVNFGTNLQLSLIELNRVAEAAYYAGKDEGRLNTDCKQCQVKEDWK